MREISGRASVAIRVSTHQDVCNTVSCEEQGPRRRTCCRESSSESSTSWLQGEQVGCHSFGPGFRLGHLKDVLIRIGIVTDAFEGASSFAPRVQKVGVVGKRPWPILGLLSSLLLRNNL